MINFYLKLYYIHHTPQNKNIMKLILSLSIMGLLILSCKKEKENQMNNGVDTVTTVPGDTMGAVPPASDTMTTSLPSRDSTAQSGKTTMPAQDSTTNKKR